jgi:hypothetical protein
MDRLLKLFLIVIVLSALASCGIFFTPMEGRWNTADPKNELQTFEPIIDGYVEAGISGLQMGSLTANDGCSQIIVLCFDTTDFPRVVAASKLQMTLAATASPDTVLSIYRIISDWDRDTISYDVVDGIDGAFFDSSRVTNFTVPTTVAAGDDIEIPLGDVFSGKKDDLANGIIICSTEYVTFKSTNDGMPPLLLVEPE